MVPASAEGEAAMSDFALLVCQLNIAKFKALLATPVDGEHRRILTALLAEEQSKEVVERAAEARDPSHRPLVSGPGSG